MHAAIIELDALADAVRPAAEDDDLVARAGIGLAFAGRDPVAFIGGVHIRRQGRELGGAGVDALVDRHDGEAAPAVGDVRFPAAGQLGEALVGEAHLLEPQHGRRIGGQALAAHRFLGLDDLLDLAQEPRVDAAGLVDLFHGQAGPEALRDQHAAGRAWGRAARCASAP